MRNKLWSCSFLVIAVGLPSQTVHLVGPGGFADVDAALAVAAPGDVVHVAPGQYPSFTVTIPVTIRALPYVSGPAPEIAGSPPVTIDVAAARSVRLVNFRFDQVVVSGGRAVFDRCTFRTSMNTMLTVLGATAHLIGCDLQSYNLFGFANAVSATDADVTAVSSSLLGSFGFYPAPAVQLADSRFFGSDLWLRGGDGIASTSAVAMTGSSELWLSDSELVSTSLACAIQSSGQLVRLDRCTFVGGSSGPCAPPASGPPQLGIRQDGHLSPGVPFDLAFTLEPGGAVFVLAGFGLDTIDVPPLLAQPSWLTSANKFVDAVLLTDAAGEAAYGVTLPANPAIVDAAVWFEGIGLGSGGLQVSAVAGGVVR